MKQFKKSLNILRRKQSQYRDYFNDSTNKIARTNLNLLLFMSSISFILTLFYYAFTLFFFPAKSIPFSYIMYTPLFLGFAAFSIYYKKKYPYNPQLVQIVTVLYTAALSSFIIVLSVFSHASEPEVFMSLFIMLLPVLFIYRFSHLMIIICFSETVFIALAESYKDPQILPHDIFITFNACLFATISALIIYSLRTSDNRDKNIYMHLSSTDSLTGIMNKRSCETLCKQYLAMRKPSETCAMFVIDLDYFKKVNDTLGHQAGDIVLNHMGKSLAQIFRTSDIIGRIGGDEFLVLMRDIKNNSILESKAHQIQEAVRNVPIDRDLVSASCSMGIAVSSAEHISYNSLFELADMSLYKAKESGRNTFVINDTVASSGSTADKKLMLIVDDDVIERKILSKIFKDKFNIIEASNGKEAAELMDLHGSDISIILLDIIMPQMNGYELLDYMHSTGSLSKIPVLVITADAQNEQKALTLGAADLIIKPISPLVVKLRVSNIIEHWNQ